MTQSTPAPGPVLPSLQPPGWAEAPHRLCEPLIGADPRWDGEILLPYVAYGVDRGDSLGLFEASPDSLIEIRALARASLVGIEVRLDRLEYEGFEVLDVHGSYYAAEKLLDPGFMRELQERLDTSMLAAGIPCRGHLYVTAGVQDEHALRRFLHLIDRQHAVARQPLFGLPALVQDGDTIGVLRLADEEEDEDDHEILVVRGEP